jgi:hypothetical protein
MTTEVYEHFRVSLELTRKKLASADSLIQQMLLAHTVTLMEVYFQQLVELIITRDANLLLKLAQAKHFESHKLTLAAAIKGDPRQYLLAMVKEFNFHSLGDTEPLLRQAFNIKISITPELVDLIKLRNDVVHRNGHNKAGQPIELSPDAVLAATRQVETLVASADQQAMLLLAQSGHSTV